MELLRCLFQRFRLCMSCAMEEAEEDRLSELPDSIIFEIFGLLPMRDVVRTTCLSKRWNNLWTTTPYLNFDDYDGSHRHRHRHPFEFVKQALTMWRGLKIMKFKFKHYLFDDNKPVFSHIDMWMRLAKENGIEELSLKLLREDGALYVVPHNLYSCASLKVLSLGCCDFQNHGNVQWNQLKSLTIRCVLIDQNLIDKIMFGSPQLEVFILDFWKNDENISIRSSCLKKLSIQKEFDDDEKPSSELRLWSPNLETLDFLGLPYAKYSLMNISSLTHLTLTFYFGEVDYNVVDFVGEVLGQIFPAIRHVEKLTLSDPCFKVLTEMKEKYLLSPLSNFKFLTFMACVQKYEEILDLLQIFPKLETLVLQIEYNYPSDIENHSEMFLQLEKNLPKNFLSQLKTVELICEEDANMMFRFIEILLKRASEQATEVGILI